MNDDSNEWLLLIIIVAIIIVCVLLKILTNENIVVLLLLLCVCESQLLNIIIEKPVLLYWTRPEMPIQCETWPMTMKILLNINDRLVMILARMKKPMKTMCETESYCVCESNSIQY